MVSFLVVGACPFKFILLLLIRCHKENFKLILPKYANEKYKFKKSRNNQKYLFFILIYSNHHSS